MLEKLTCQVCTATLIKTKINGITVYECPICGQLHNTTPVVIPANAGIHKRKIHYLRFLYG